MEARSGIGLLYQLDDDWFIDSNYRNDPSYFFEYLGILIHFHTF